MGGEARGLNESVKKGKFVTNFFSDKCWMISADVKTNVTVKQFKK